MEETRDKGNVLEEGGTRGCWGSTGVGGHDGYGVREQDHGDLREEYARKNRGNHRWRRLVPWA